MPPHDEEPLERDMVVVDAATMSDDELERLARALVAAQDEAVRRLKAE
jgi:hypothetical protein